MSRDALMRHHHAKHIGAAAPSMPRGRPPRAVNKPVGLDQSVPRAPYNSTKRNKRPTDGDLLQRLYVEVCKRAFKIVKCDDFDRWLAAFAASEGNDYIRRDRHEHTYNSTHHRVVTYGCSHTRSAAPSRTGQASDGAAGETRACEVILDIYYFYGRDEYQIVRLHEHQHYPTNTPIAPSQEDEAEGLTGAMEEPFDMSS